METMQKVPAAAEVQAALQTSESLWTQWMLLGQNNRVDAHRVAQFHQHFPDDGLPALADTIEQARRAFNTAIYDRVEAAKKRAQELSDAFVQDLLGTALPAEVTLPLGDSGRNVTFTVTGLASVSGDGETLGGFLRVSSQGGRAHSTERFYRKDGRLHFAEPDLY